MKGEKRTRENKFDGMESLVDMVMSRRGEC